MKTHPKGTIIFVQRINKQTIHCCNSDIVPETPLWDEWMSECMQGWCWEMQR